MNMKNLKKKVVSLALLLTMSAAVVPFCDFQTVNASSARSGSSYTSSGVLAKRIDNVLSGNIGLYRNSGCSSSYRATLGSKGLNKSNRFYIKNKTTGATTYGKQCYIYANAVYNTLYNEYVGRGSGLKHSKVVLKGGKTISYSRFASAGVKCGAYVRTTSNSRGSYNGSQGHSFVVLSYNKSTITYVEGNADGKGLVRLTTKTWAAANKALLSGRGRYLCHVVQPTESYYRKLTGSSSGSSSASSQSKNTASVSSTPNPTGNTYTRSLYYKKSSVMTGSDVKYIQNCLKKAGYSVTVNGKYDSQTADAVRAFQKDNGLKVDGGVGKQTWPAIVKAASGKAVATKTSAATTSVSKTEAATTTTTEATAAADAQ